MMGVLRIAIADDEPDIRDYLERCLPRLGHQVVAVAKNGRELVQFCRAVQPDLVITDIRMPELDGIDAAIQICDERPVPVILIAADRAVKLAERARLTSTLAFLAKPIKQADLKLAIAQASYQVAPNSRDGRLDVDRAS